MTHPIKAFEALRNKSSGGLKTKEHRAADAVYVQIVTDESKCAYLRVVDSKGRPVHRDYRAYNGRMRLLLKEIQHCQTLSKNQISWGIGSHAEHDINLHEFTDLTPLLAECDRIVDADMNPIQRPESIEHLSLSLRKEPEQNLWGVQYALSKSSQNATLETLSNPLFLSDAYLISEGRMCHFQNCGGAFQNLPLFIERVPQADLETFLSLFASSFPQVSIRIDTHEVEIGERFEAQPTIYFREVDDSSTLYMEVLDSIPPLSESFTKQFDISTLAVIQDSTLLLREIDYQASFQTKQQLTARLEKLSRKKGAPPDTWFAVDEEDGTFLLGKGFAATFLAEELSQLVKDFKIVGADHLLRYKIRYAKPRLKLNLSGGSGIDFLEGDGSIDLAGQQLSILTALSEYRKKGYIEMQDGNRTLIDPDYMARLERLFKKKKDKVQLSVFDLPFIEEEMEARLEEAAMPRVRSIFEAFNGIPQRRPKITKFKGTLRPYQKDGLKWLDYLYEYKLGGCLADDMGLGKTIQTIALLSKIYPKTKKPTLLIMPKSLTFNWMREFEKFAPHIRTSLHYGPGRNWESANDAEVILSTYGTVRSDIEEIVGTALHAIILDESHAIKNIQSQTTRAILSLKANFRLALSGTPLENNLGELYSLFRFLNPAMFRTQSEFERDYVMPIEKNGDKDAAQELRRKIHPFILRRLKQDVLDDLPEKIEQTLYVDMSPEQLKHYETRRQFYQEIIRDEMEKNGLARSRFTILEAMLELRQIATIPEVKTDGKIASAKVERLIEAVVEATANGHKCLVFTNFLAGIELVCDALTKEGIDHLSMSGATNNRQELVEKFQQDHKIRAFVMTLKTGGVGLNLTAADQVFILDPWWNQSAESQAIDRAHRIGQRNAVFTYRLITRKSIEEKIQKLQEKKRALVDQIVTTDGDSFKHLDESDIDALFND